MKSKKKFNVGIIGTGMWGKIHVEYFMEDPRSEVTWIVDKALPLMEKFKKRYKIPNGSGDYSDMLKDDDLDAVVIASPPFTHTPIALDVLRAGKHVFIEKPMSINRREMNRLLRETEKRPGQVALTGDCRYAQVRPRFDFVRDFIRKGKLGKVYSIYHCELQRGTFIEHNPRGAWAMRKDLAGAGPCIDWGVYDLAFHLGVLDDKPELKSVKSLTKSNVRDMSHYVEKADIEQHAIAFMEFTGGLTYYYERGAGVHCEAQSETRIIGTKGGLRFSFLPWDTEEIEYFYVDKDNKGKPRSRTVKARKSSVFPNDNVPVDNHFLNCLQGKEKPFTPISLSAKHLDIIFKILK